MIVFDIPKVILQFREKVKIFNFSGPDLVWCLWTLYVCSRDMVCSLGTVYTWYALLGQYILYGQVGSWRDLFCETDSFQKNSVYFWKSRFWGYPSFKNLQMNKRNWQLVNGRKLFVDFEGYFSFQKKGKFIWKNLDFKAAPPLKNIKWMKSKIEILI